MKSEMGQPTVIEVDFDPKDANAAAQALIRWFESQQLGPSKALVVMSIVTAIALHNWKKEHE